MDHLKSCWYFPINYVLQFHSQSSSPKIPNLDKVFKVRNILESYKEPTTKNQVGEIFPPGVALPY